MGRIAKLAVVLSLAVVSARGWTENVEQCVQCAEQFLEENSSPDAEARWQLRWQQDLEQAMADNPILDENKYLNQRLMNALAGKSFESLSAKDRLLACRYYLLYRQKGLAVPERVKPHLTDANLKKLFKPSSLR
ncbi:MAG TPA: hypothetical protein VEK08_26145 [Planctomycetota bacterium]|nr:hypothetical protein [Planctomycetota bacterium]